MTADDIDGDGVMNSADVDDDNDRLIEIRNLEMFNNIRFNLAGTTYDDEDADTGTGDAGVDAGCPAAGCNGYELMVNLDFAETSSYASGNVNTTWCPDTSNNCIDTTSGFPGIGAASGDTGGFAGIFEGNGNSISNFYSRNTANTDDANIGLFASTNGGTIRNIAVVDANLFGGTAADRIGGLVGNNTGTIIASSASVSGTGTSNADGGAGANDGVGGLVGQNEGTIIASSARLACSWGGSRE